MSFYPPNPPCETEPQPRSERVDGQMDGLYYALSLVYNRRSGAAKTPDYLAALADIETFLLAAVDRLFKDEPIYSTATCQCGAAFPEPIFDKPPTPEIRG